MYEMKYAPGPWRLEERSPHIGAEAFRPGTDEYKQHLRDQAAVAVLPEILRQYGGQAEQHGWDEAWREGIAQDAARLADALVAALYPEEGEP